MVAVLTPHATHYQLAMQCLRNGCDVVCEKPLAVTTFHCDKMIDFAAKNKLILTAYHNRHWDGSIMRAMKVIKSGKIGKVIRIDTHTGSWRRPETSWHSSISASGGIAYSFGVHLLEYVLQIVDSRIDSVTAFAHKGFWAGQTGFKSDANEDESFGVIRFANGIWATMRTSDIDSNPSPTMVEIIGTLGAYVWDYNNWTLITHSRDGSTTKQSGKHPPRESWRFYKNITEHLIKGTKLIITGQWSRRPVHIIDLMSRSAEKGITLRARYS